MNVDKKCRLCWEVNPDFSQTLYDNSGGCTEVYEITVKFFDPMLLVNFCTDNYNSQSTIICQECWTHIKNFHEFQQNVLRTQSRLIVDVKPLIEEVKEESVHSCSDNDGNNSNCINTQNDSHDPYATKLDNVGNRSIDKFQQGSAFDRNEHLQLSLSDFKEESEQRTNYENDVGSDLDYNDHPSSDDIPLGKIISRNKTPEPTPGLKRNCRVSRKRKQCVTGNPSQEKFKSKGFTNEGKKSSKNIAHNSAQKIQELDNFIAEVKPQLECDLCKNNFPNYNTLRAHFTDVHQMKCFIMCCDRKIYRRYLLVEHLRMHVNPETFKCEICGAISASSRTLIAHKRFMHHTAKSLECEVCHRKFKGKPTLIRHMATHATGSKDFKCTQCDRCFAFEFQLKLHINNVHSEIKICDQCGKTLHGAAALKQHLLQHSGAKQTKWPCDQCDAQLASLWGLKSHKLSFHPDGSTAFICKECGKVASSETTLKRHKRLVHQLERKYKCNYCEKAFKKNSHLKDHIAIHTGQHIHQCSLCSQTFINSGSLHKHRKKIHPAEWNESRQHRIDLPKVNADCVLREVLL